MFFAFRWLLVNFKREFPYNDVMSLWEAIWSCVLSPDYALFIALAILGKYKEEIVKEEDQSGIIRVRGVSLIVVGVDPTVASMDTNVAGMDRNVVGTGPHGWPGSNCGGCGPAMVGVALLVWWICPY